ncbi:hypothetical protein Taro_050127 [Colocasia esculenta]|uniref:Uncharacterized protein n=1 Tax=Colocasia esculenta TaxID=4460 RepID=A0A843XCN7_COLES|nr:hypothetical protein [Colocasia esculenta]
MARPLTPSSSVFLNNGFDLYDVIFGDFWLSAHAIKFMDVQGTTKQRKRTTRRHDHQLRSGHTEDSRRNQRSRAQSRSNPRHTHRDHATTRVEGPQAEPPRTPETPQGRKAIHVGATAD